MLTVTKVLLTAGVAAGASISIPRVLVEVLLMGLGERIWWRVGGGEVTPGRLLWVAKCTPPLPTAPPIKPLLSSLLVSPALFDDLYKFCILLATSFLKSAGNRDLRTVVVVGAWKEPWSRGSGFGY